MHWLPEQIVSLHCLALKNPTEIVSLGIHNIHFFAIQDGQRGKYTKTVATSVAPGHYEDTFHPKNFDWVNTSMLTNHLAFVFGQNSLCGYCNVQGTKHSIPICQIN